MSMVQQAIEVGAPVHTVYEQLAAVENYPRFMTGVERVTPTGNQCSHWVMDVDGKRREFDTRITDLRPDERVSWATTAGPRMAETITVRPMGEMRTQVVAQLEADVAFLLPSDQHGQETLNRRLKADLTAFKGLVESGACGPARAAGSATTGALGGASSKRLGVASSGMAPMGGRTPANDGWGDGMINEDDRGVYDYRVQ